MKGLYRAHSPRTPWGHQSGCFGTLRRKRGLLDAMWRDRYLCLFVMYGLTSFRRVGGSVGRYFHYKDVLRHLSQPILICSGTGMCVDSSYILLKVPFLYTTRSSRKSQTASTDMGRQTLQTQKRLTVIKNLYGYSGFIRVIDCQ